MSQENVEVVRRIAQQYEGQNLVIALREPVERFAPDYETNALLAYWADHPAYKFLHADIEWDARALSGAIARGPRELALMWADWVEARESYVYRVIEYRDLGDWVLLVGDVRARGRQGIAVEMRTFEVYRVREGELARLRVFPSEGAALKAVGLPG